MMKRLSLGLLAVALVSISCRGCRQVGPARLLEVAGPDAAAVLLVPDLSRASEKLEAFLTRATRKAGSSAVSKLREGFVQQLGFDPLDPAGIAAWGIDPKQGLLVFTEATRPALVVAVAVSERAKLDAALASAAAKIDGASQTSEEKHGEVVLKSAARPFGTQSVPTLVWAHVGRYALISRPEGKPSVMAAIERLTGKADADAGTPRSLAEDPTYRELAGKIGEHEAQLFVRGSAAQAVLRGAAAPSRGVITGLRLGPEGLASDTFVALDVQGLDAALASEPALPLARALEPGAVMMLLSRHARPEAVAALKSHSALASLIEGAAAKLAGALGVDPERDILPLLAGPAALAVYLVDVQQLPHKLQARADLGALLDHVHVVLAAEVKDPAAMQALLERAALQLKELRGVSIEARELSVSGQKVKAFAPVASTRLGWAVVGNQYVYAAGPDRLARALESATAGGDGALADLEASVAKELLQKPGTSVAVLRASALAEAAQGLGAAAGSGGMLLFGAALELLRTLGDIAVGVHAEPDGLRISVREKLQ